MGDKSGIEWTDATWNPVTGCTKVSAGCKHCYAERDWARLQHLPRFAGRAFTDVVCHPERLDHPLRWKKPRRIFVNSMSDMFHDDVPDTFLDQVFAVMALCPLHTFQVLTKRARRMRDYMSDGGRAARVLDLVRNDELGYRAGGDNLPRQSWPFQNVLIGVSVEDQVTADERTPLLLQTPAAVRWISAEPLLGPVNIQSAINRMPWKIGGGDAGLHWVVVGGESGPKARPMHPDWVRSLRDQCAAAGVAFLFKQWGEWIPYEHDAQPPFLHSQHGDFFDGHGLPDFESGEGEMQREWHSDWSIQLISRRVGKKAAGRLLDDMKHDERPEVSR